MDRRGGFGAHAFPPRGSVPNAGLIAQRDSRNLEFALDTHYVDLPRGIGANPDQNIPIASIIRIMRQVMPDHVKLSDDSKEMVQECVTKFIKYVMKEANELCNNDCRRIVKSEDIIFAMQSKGFSNYVEPLNLFLAKYRAQDNILKHEYSSNTNFVQTPLEPQFMMTLNPSDNQSYNKSVVVQTQSCGAEAPAQQDFAPLDFILDDPSVKVTELLQLYKDGMNDHGEGSSSSSHLDSFN